MAGIIHRFGTADEFDPYKLRAAEFGLVILGNEIYPSNSLYFCYSPGNVKLVATFDDMVTNINNALERVTDEFLESINRATADAETATATANTSAQLASDNALLADVATTRATLAAQDAEAVVLGDIATDTTVGVVRGNGDVSVGIDGVMSVNEASNANVTVVEAVEDGEITTGLLGTIIGIIKKKFAIILTVLAGKIDKTSIVQSTEISDATKPPSSVVTAWLASQISSLALSLATLNNNLADLDTEFDSYLLQGNIYTGLITDLNTCTKKGTYQMLASNATIANMPTVSGDVYGILKVNASTLGGDFIWQKIITINFVEYKRVRSNGTWSAWV